MRTSLAVGTGDLTYDHRRRGASTEGEASTMSQFDLSGRVALVTGASKGIGEGIAVGLAEAGADVAILGRDQEGLERVDARVASSGHRHVTLTSDVTRTADIERAVGEVHDALGSIDILVNNAGVNRLRPLREYSEDDWDLILTTNLKGYFLVAKAVVGDMIDAGWGRIVNVSSILAKVAIAGQSAYAASKGGVDQLTRVMALEWAPYGVCVNALSPGYVNIERMRVLYKGSPVMESSVEKTPLGRWAEVEDIAGPAVFLSSPAAAFMTGHALVVDGGWTVQ